MVGDDVGTFVGDVVGWFVGELTVRTMSQLKLAFCPLCKVWSIKAASAYLQAPPLSRHVARYWKLAQEIEFASKPGAFLTSSKHT
jgi:hypothetical protein